MTSVVYADSSQAVTHDPRAFGWRIGDRVHRDITIHAPAGLQLDPESLPRAGLPGQAIELRTLSWKRFDDGAASRYEFALDYQVFTSPPQVKTLEMPPLKLHFTGTPRAEDVRVEAWPLTVSPLVPVEVSPRRGLGEMQPDTAPPPVDTAPAVQRLRLLIVAAALLSVYLASVYLGLPWWARRHRPFEMAWRRLRSMPMSSDAASDREARRAMHAALDRSAGEVLFAGGVDRFIAQRPAFAPLRDDLLRFFDSSRRAFFADQADTNHDRAAVVDLCRRCRDIERGAA